MTRLSKGVNNKGLGLVIRQTVVDEAGNIVTDKAGNPELTGVMLRWYPGSSRAAHNDPNWKVADGQTKFTGPEGEGFKTPQSEFWARPGSVESVLGEMGAADSALGVIGFGPMIIQAWRQGWWPTMIQMDCSMSPAMCPQSQGTL